MHFDQLCCWTNFSCVNYFHCHNEAFCHKFIIIYGRWNSHVLLFCCWPLRSAEMSWSGNRLFGHTKCENKWHCTHFARIARYIKCKCLRANHPHKTWVFIRWKPRIHKCAYTYLDSIMNMHIKLYHIRAGEGISVLGMVSKTSEQTWHTGYRIRNHRGKKNAHPNQFIVLRLYENDNISISQDNNPYNMFYGTYNNEKSFRTINKINIFIHLVAIS